MTNLLAFLAATTMKATVILVLAAMVAWLMRHRTAATRHLIWAAGLGSTLAVFALGGVLPPWRVIPLASPVTSTAVTRALTPLSLPVQGEAATWPVPPTSSRTGTPPARSKSTTEPDWPARLLFLWAIGAAVLLARSVVGRIALSRLARSSAAHDASESLLQQLGREMGVTRRVHVSCSDDVELPMTWGIVHPRILLPTDVLDWSSDCRRHVLQHELAHISRGDAATQLLAQVATALFWFHPLVWLAAARMRTERERACDDLVLASGTRASDYAADLLAFVTQHGFARPQAVALGFAERTKFEQRLEALLDPSLPRGVLTPGRVALVLSLSTALVVPLAALERAVADAGLRTPTHAETVVVLPAPAAEPRHTLRKTLRESVTSLEPRLDGGDTSDVFAGCALRMKSQHSDGRSDGDSTSTWVATGENDGCSYTLASVGTVVLNSDATAIDQISAGGALDLATSIHGDLTRLIVRGTAAGGISYEFSRNGQPLDFAAMGPLWLKRFLLCLDRTTAFAIDRRFPLLLAAGGPGNVLAEVERMHSEHAMSVYLLRLVRTTTLDSRTIAMVGQLVSRMVPQHMAGEVIIAVAIKQVLTDELRAEFARAADGIRESNERSRALAALARRR